MKNSSNFQLLEKIKSGNSRYKNEALRTIYDQELPRMYQYFRKNGYENEHVQDTFQEALTIFYQQVIDGRFREETSISSYIRVISRNIQFNRMRKSKHMKLLSLNEDTPFKHSLLDAPTFKNPYPLEILLNQSSAGCQELLRSFYFEQKSMAEIQYIIGLKSPQSTKSKKCRCLKKLSAICKSLNLHQEDIVF